MQVREGDNRQDEIVKSSQDKSIKKASESGGCLYHRSDGISVFKKDEFGSSKFGEQRNYE